MAVNALEETLAGISRLFGFEIQLKPEQRKSIINLLRGEDVIAILPTLRDTKKV
jgi:superfamily II DNA helicase RecQ